MPSLTVQGAYNRDYESAAEMVHDLLRGKDFRGTNPALGLMGTIFSARDFESMGVNELSLRFNQDRDVDIAKIKDGVICLRDLELDNTWQPVELPEPESRTRTVDPDSFCRGCGNEGAGDCLRLDCVELDFDSLVMCYCPDCGDCQELETDASGSGCHTPGCSGKLTSPYRLMGLI